MRNNVSVLKLIDSLQRPGPVCPQDSGHYKKSCIPNAGLSTASPIRPKLFTASVAGDVFAAISDTGSDGTAAPSSGTWLSLLQIRQKRF